LRTLTWHAADGVSKRVASAKIKSKTMNALKLNTVLALLILPQIGRADPLDTWTWRHPLQTANKLLSVAYGNGQFVAVGERGTIVTSGDGVTWVQPPHSGTQDLAGIVYGNGQFVAVGSSDSSGSILTSADGTTWIQQQSGTNELSGIGYGSGQFIAVGSSYADGSGIILTSADGVSWVQRASGSTNGLESVVYGNGQFVAVAGDFDGRGAIIFTSTDGLNWIRRQSGTPSYLRAITYGNGHFVAVGYHGTILQSGSIITLAVTPNAESSLLKLSLEGPSGLGYAIETSTDLISWRNLTNITTAQDSNVIFDALPAASQRVFYRAYSQ